MQKLDSRFTSFGLRNHHLVKFQPSNLERHSDALFLADHLPITDLATTMQGEIAHIHSGSDYSLHVVLAPADCKLHGHGPCHTWDASRRAVSVLYFPAANTTAQARKLLTQAGVSAMPFLVHPP
jgi:hypothetical protein